ncbi:ice-binding family protein, partial [Frankia sp. CpI1-P]
AANVFWIVGSSATLGTYSVLSGNILASVSPVTYELIGY